MPKSKTHRFKKCFFHNKICFFLAIFTPYHPNKKKSKSIITTEGESLRAVTDHSMFCQYINYTYFCFISEAQSFTAYQPSSHQLNELACQHALRTEHQQCFRFNKALTCAQNSETTQQNRHCTRRLNIASYAQNQCFRKDIAMLKSGKHNKKSYSQNVNQRTEF